MKNNGPNNAKSLIACDLFNPKFLKYISDDSHGNYNYKTGLWNVGTLNNGTKKDLDVVLTVIASQTTVNNYAFIKSSSINDTKSFNNKAETTLIIPATADLKFNPNNI